MPTYPATLPLPQLQSYQLDPVDNTIRSEMSTGLVIQRRIAPNAPTRMSATWRLSAAELALLEGWLEHEVGTGYFTMPVSVPLGLLDHSVRVLGRLGGYRKLSANYWECSATVEIRRAQTLSAEEVAVLTTVGPSIFQRAVDLLHTLIHVDLPNGKRWQ